MKNNDKSMTENSGVIYRRYITLPNGKVLDARDYGYNAWPIGKGKPK